jgi:DNA polymerase III epsilon subunit-like protein
MKVLVFDTETTGLPTERNASISDLKAWPYIVQLSYILYDIDEKKIIKCQDHIIKIDPAVEITEGSIAIHGITQITCQRKGIPIKDALMEFNKHLELADRIVGHNVAFDKKMVMVECFRNQMKQQFTINSVRKSECCTMKYFTDACAIEKISKEGNPYFKFPTLTELHYHFFKVKPKSIHDAMADVLICLRCYAYGLHKQDITKEGCSKTKELYGLYCL